MSIANLEAAVEAAQLQTDVTRDMWAAFVRLVVSSHERLADGTLRGRKRLRAKQDLKFTTDQAVAAEKDHSTAMASELRLRRELDEARKERDGKLLDIAMRRP